MIQRLRGKIQMNVTEKDVGRGNYERVFKQQVTS